MCFVWGIALRGLGRCCACKLHLETSTASGCVAKTCPIPPRSTTLGGLGKTSAVTTGAALSNQPGLLPSLSEELESGGLGWCVGCDRMVVERRSSRPKRPMKTNRANVGRRAGLPVCDKRRGTSISYGEDSPFAHLDETGDESGVQHLPPPRERQVPQPTVNPADPKRHAEDASRHSEGEEEGLAGQQTPSLTQPQQLRPTGKPSQQ